jgi:hypothetical protein
MNSVLKYIFKQELQKLLNVGFIYDLNGSPHVKELLNLRHVDFKVATKVFKWI